MTARRVVVIGAGLVGASIGCALTRAGHLVHLEDRVASHAVVAAGRSAGTTEPAPTADVALVVVAVPPDAVASVVADSLERFPDAVVTDVASVKASVLAALDALVEEAGRYCGSHPMAGSQLSGPITADPELFTDRTWVLTPHEASLPKATEMVEWLARECGARVVLMDARDHDQAVAQVSHVPQIMSSLTAGHLREVPAEHLTLAGQGIRDVTRIAGSDPVLWRQIIGANAAAVRAELEAIRADLDALLASLDDPAAIEAFISQGRAGVRSLPGKHGTPPRDLQQVVIEIPDAPGALARLFADIEGVGVNVEDLQIEHDPARQVGFLSVMVVPELAERLTLAMLDHGWHLR